MNEVALTSAIAALAGAIAFMYRQSLKSTTRIEKRLDACEEDRARLWERLSKISSP